MYRETTIEYLLVGISDICVQVNSLLVKRWLSQVIRLLKVVVTQSTEDNLLTRITQLGLTTGLIENIVDHEELAASTAISENNPAKVRLL